MCVFFVFVFVLKQILRPHPQRFWLKCRLLGPIPDQLKACILVWFLHRLFKDYILIWFTTRFLSNSKQYFHHVPNFTPSKEIQWLLIGCLLNQPNIFTWHGKPSTKGSCFPGNTPSYYSATRTSIVISLLRNPHCPIIPTLQNLMLFYFPSFKNLAMVFKLNKSQRLVFPENYIGGGRVWVTAMSVKHQSFLQVDWLTCVNSPPQNYSLCYFSVQESILWFHHLVRTLPVCGLLVYLEIDWSHFSLCFLTLWIEQRPLELWLKQKL